MKATVDVLGQGKVTIPAPIRRRLGIEEDDSIEIEVTEVYKDNDEDDDSDAGGTATSDVEQTPLAKAGCSG